MEYPTCFVKGCPNCTHGTSDLLCREHLGLAGSSEPAPTPGSLAERFRAKPLHPAGDCQLWGGARRADGYGVIGYKGVQLYAHRVSWEVANGRPIPVGKVVMHVCDTPPCVNPDHLNLGTKADNAADMKGKGRASRPSGSKNPSARLTVDDVRAIRRRHPEGATLQSLADEFGVTLGAVWQVIQRRTWKDVA